MALDARGISASELPSFRKSSRSLPAVNTPEPPVMMMQRIAGLFCAVSIASLMARYISCVIAFFFSGRRRLITRVASSSVTNRCPVMKPSLQQAAKGAAGDSSNHTLHHLHVVPNPPPPFFNSDSMTREEDAMQLTGIHHLTAISAKPRENLAFYTGLLGMRLVKKTVNQDDVSAYHLFYADGKANPGTDLTFFDFPAAPERRGSDSISRTGLRVAGEKSLGYWSARLKQAGAPVGDVIEVDGRLTLPFEDGEGQLLALIDDGGAGTASPWERSTVPVEHQIRGLGPIELTVRNLASAALV